MKKILLDPEHRARQKKIRKMLAAGLPLAVLMSGISGCIDNPGLFFDEDDFRGERIPEPCGEMTACEESGEREFFKPTGLPLYDKKIVDEGLSPESLPAVHVVKTGDTLSSIARQYDTTVAKLKELNSLTGKQADLIKPGQEIKLK